MQWPLFLAEHGEVVPASELVPPLREVRWELKRIAEAPGTHADVIQTCVGFLLSGVSDDTARENLIRLVQHANCLQRACADRLQRA